MCGRFTLTTADYEAVAAALDAEIDPEAAAAYRPRFNVAPTDHHPILLCGPQDDGPAGARRRKLTTGTWGLSPPPRPGAARPGLQINVRSEGLQRGYIRTAFVRHRCAVVADGFYEWTGPKQARKPIRFHRPDGGPFVFAGVCLTQTDPRTGERGPHFAILTTAANELVARAHDRMPVVLAPGDVDAWLRPGEDTATLERLQALLVPAPPGLLVASPASTRVNDVKNDDPDCLVPNEQPTLPGL